MKALLLLTLLMKEGLIAQDTSHQNNNKPILTMNNDPKQIPPPGFVAEKLWCGECAAYTDHYAFECTKHQSSPSPLPDLGSCQTERTGPGQGEGETPPCSTHPDAPHGFDRDGSHTAGRYVCDCEHWVPSDDGPCGEDGPWAEGWEARSGQQRQDRGQGEGELSDCIDDAWGVIANAIGWGGEHPEWKTAAERWRDKWLPIRYAKPAPQQPEQQSAVEWVRENLGIAGNGTTKYYALDEHDAFALARRCDEAADKLGAAVRNSDANLERIMDLRAQLAAAQAEATEMRECVWTGFNAHGRTHYRTCRGVLNYTEMPRLQFIPFCPACGGRVKIEQQTDDQS